MLDRESTIGARGRRYLDHRLGRDRAGGEGCVVRRVLGFGDRAFGQLAQVEVPPANATAPVLGPEAAQLQGAEQQDDDGRDQDRHAQGGRDLREAVAEVDRADQRTASPRRRSHCAPPRASSSAAAPMPSATSRSWSPPALALWRPGAPKARSPL
jgi:hypothetical protein